MSLASYRRIVLDLGCTVTLPALPFTATPCQRAWLTHRPTARRLRAQPRRVPDVAELITDRELRAPRERWPVVVTLLLIAACCVWAFTAVS